MVARTSLALALLAACATPAPVPGGGVRGSFDGELDVTVLREDSLAPLGGAEVWVDGVEVGVTDDQGRLSVSTDAVERVEARLDGFVSTAFVGANARVATIPLAADGRGSTATVRGEVAGFADLEVPAGSVARASIGFGRADVGAAPPAATCDGPGPCTFEIEVPAGRVQLFAQIDAVDLGPTPEPDDDVVTPLSFGLSGVLRLGAAEVRDAVRVERFADSAISVVEVVTPGPASGIDAVVGVPGVGLTDIALLFFANPGQRAYALPEPTGGLAQAAYWAVAVGTGPDGETVTVTREPRGSAVETLRPPAPVSPATARRDGDGYVVSGLDGADLWELRAPGLRVVVFDGRDRVAAPDGAASVVTWQAPAQDDGWDLREVTRRFTRRSTSAVP